MIDSQWICAFFLLLFTVVATVDGLYFHLYKYRLFARKESLREHHLHTWNAFLFPMTVVLLFVINASGVLLWVSLLLTLLTLFIEFLDVFEEKSSRKSLGGLTSLEYSMHFAMSGIRATYTTLIFAQKPLQAWSLWGPWHGEMPVGFSFLRVMGACVAFLGIFVFILHYYLGRNCERYGCS